MVLVAAAACMLLLSGCSVSSRPEDNSGQNAVSQTEEEDQLIRVGFSQLGSESLWRDANSKSIQNALTRENGYFLIFKNARQQQENQVKAVRSFISQQVDYIAIAPVTQDGWDTVLEEAREAGIPVILVDRQVSVEDESLYTAFIGTDSREEGRKAGRWLETYLEDAQKENDPVNIVVLAGTIGSSAQSGRSAGFREIAADHANWNIAAEVSGDFTTAKGKEAMNEVLQNTTDIDVVVSQNDDMTFGALEALEEAGAEVGDGGIQIISFDAAKEALEMVRDGIISCEIECNALQGPYLDELIKKLENGEDYDKITYVDEEVFTIDNVSEAIADREY